LLTKISVGKNKRVYVMVGLQCSTPLWTICQQDRGGQFY